MDFLLNIGLAFVSALAGAYAGTRAAMQWQHRREEKQRKSDQEATIFKAAILCRHYAEVTGKIEKKINHNGRKLEWYEVNLVEIFMPSPLGQDVPALLAHLGKEHTELVEDLIHAEWVAKSAISVSSSRDSEYREVQKCLIQNNAPQKITKEQAVSIIGPAWAAKLDSQTKELHAAVDAAMTQNKDCHGALLLLLPKEKRSRQRFEKIDPKL